MIFAVIRQIFQVSYEGKCTSQLMFSFCVCMYVLCWRYIYTYVKIVASLKLISHFSKHSNVQMSVHVLTQSFSQKQCEWKENRINICNNNNNNITMNIPTQRSVALNCEYMKAAAEKRQQHPSE